jgi:hypothetical protein
VFVVQARLALGVTVRWMMDGWEAGQMLGAIFHQGEMECDDPQLNAF